MDLHFFGKTAVVTCASSGIGRACVLRLLQEGAEVIAISRHISIGGFAGISNTDRLHLVQANMNDGLEFQAQFNQALVSLHLKPTILVFVPMREPNLSLKDVDFEQIEVAMDRNFSRFMFLVKKLIPGMMELSFGRIVTLLGASTLAPLADHVLANVSRISIASVCAGIGREYASFNICANNILLGVIDTPGLNELWERRAKTVGIDLSEYVHQTKARIPVRRLGRPDECANLCALLTSPTLGYLNGQTLLMDGGLNPSL